MAHHRNARPDLPVVALLCAMSSQPAHAGKRRDPRRLADDYLQSGGAAGRLRGRAAVVAGVSRGSLVTAAPLPAATAGRQAAADLCRQTPHGLGDCG